MKKKILYKSLLFLLIIVCINVIYSYTFFSSDLKKNSPCAYQCQLLPAGIDVVYFGESSNTAFAKDDSTRKSISGLVQFFNPEIKIATIDTFAVHAGIYKHWTFQFKENKPKALVVTMNLRSFDAAWINSTLETPLLKSIRLVQTPVYGFNRLALALKMPDEKTEKEREQDMLQTWIDDELSFPYPFRYKNVRQWDDAMANGEAKPIGTEFTNEQIILGCHYIKGFAFNIRESNPRIKDFDEIVEWGNENKVKIYFNLLAENIKEAEYLVGKELVYLMRQNRDYLVNRYTKMGAVVIDNMELLEPENFIDRNWTTEHYNDKGRIAIAKNIVKQLSIKK